MVATEAKMLCCFKKMPKILFCEVGEYKADQTLKWEPAEPVP